MYNEAGTILFVLNKLKKALQNIEFEIVVVDDGSQDQSGEEVEKFIALNPHLPVFYFRQDNQGKGGAIRTAIKNATGEILVVQDADLEYDPKDILPLLTPFEEGELVVYGSRNMNKEKREHSTLLFYWGGLLVTFTTNWLFGSRLTDEATGYKLFHSCVFDRLQFHHNDFAWEPEITAKILKQQIAIIEKPITYKPRSKGEGKKITWRDGLKAIWVLLVERLRP
jgi:glycosyltransferase involved in cell wall biosynthesis